MRDAGNPQISLKIVPRRRWLGALTALGGLAWLSKAWPQVGSGGTGSPVVAASVGVADFVNGSVTLTRGGAAQALLQGTLLEQGDQLDTARGAELHAKFDDGGYLAVRPNSSVRIDHYVAQGEASDLVALSLIRGALRSVTGWIGKIGAPQQYKITAGTATIGVRGTDHEVVYVPEELATPDVPAGLHNRVNEGATTLRNERGQIDIAQGAAGYAPRSGELPRLHERMPGFFNRLRTGNEQRLVQHNRVLRGFMESKLRERGKLTANENFGNFLERHRATPGPGTGAGAGSNTAAERQQERGATREQRQLERQEQQRQRRELKAREHEARQRGQHQRP